MANKDGPSQGEKYMIMAQKFVNDKGLIVFNQTAYFYHEGIWREESWENTMSWISFEYMNDFKHPLMSGGVNEILNMIRSITYNIYRAKIKYKLGEDMDNEICLRDGILNLDKMDMRDYSKSEFKFSKLNFSLKNKPKMPEFQKFLNTSMGFGHPFDPKNGEILDDWKKVMGFIQEWMGYSLTYGNPLERALILTSKGRNGKGTLIHIWSAILGKENCSSLGLEALNNDQYIESTNHKLVNFSYDSTKGGQLDTEVVKRAVSGEPVQASTKYKPNFTFKFTAKLVIACNDLPFTSSTDANVRDRFHILPFDAEFTEVQRDPDLKKKLEKEAEDIFSWAIEGLKRLRARGGFDVPDRCKIAMGEYLEEYDTVAQWLKDRGLTDPKRRAKRSELWTDYKDWSRDGALKPYGRTKFFKMIRRKGFKEVKVGNDREFYMEGIAPPMNSPDNNPGNAAISNVKPKNEEDLPF